jgi:hypothetical protein
MSPQSRTLFLPVILAGTLAWPARFAGSELPPGAGPSYPPLRTAREQQAQLAAVGVGPWPNRANPSAEQRIRRALDRGSAGGRQGSRTRLSQEMLGQLRTELSLYHGDTISQERVRAWTDSVQARLFAGSHQVPVRGPAGSGPEIFGSLSSEESEARLMARLLDEIAPGTARDLRVLAGKAGTPGEGLFAAGKTGSQAVAAGSVMLDGARSVAPSLTAGPVMATLGQWTGPIGWGALTAYEGFTVWQWQAGYMTDRQFTRHQAHFMGGLAAGAAAGWAGAKAGALAGGAIGALFGPAGVPVGAAVGAAVGALSGGVLGGTAGSRLGTMGVRSVFEFQDRRKEAEYLRFLQQHYGVP